MNAESAFRERSGKRGASLKRFHYRIGDLEVDTGVREVRRDGILIPLPPLSFDLLLALARQAPNLITIEELEKDVWAGLVVSPATVAKRVALLREALGDNAESPTYIAVARGQGYRLLAPVSRQVKVKPGTSVLRPPANRTGWLVGLAIAGIVALTLALAVNFYDQADESPEAVISSDSPDGKPQWSTPDELPKGRSVAVLPFANLSESEDDQYIADGIAEEIINRLTAMKSLRVVARTSSFAFRDTEETVDAIAQKLRVSHVIEGSVQLQKENIRVTVQLIDARSGYHLWSKKFDRPFSDVFAIQDSIAASVASAFDSQFAESTQTETGGHLTSSTKAYAHFLKGRALLHKRLELKGPGIDASIAAFRAATGVDPEFADAWAGLSKALWLRSVSNGDQYRHEEDLATAAALTALELDPGNAGARAVLGAIDWRKGSFERAKTNFEMALHQSVVDTDVRLWAGILMDSVGYTDRAYALYEEANRLDPLNPSVITFLSKILVMRGEPEKAARLLSGQIRHDWQDLNRGKIALTTGHYDQAREFLSNLELPVGTLPDRYVEDVIQAMIDEHRKPTTEAAILQAVETGNIDRKVAYQLLWLMGSAAILEVSDGVATGLLALHISTNAWDSRTAAFRSDQRFHDWAVDVGLVQFWNANSWPRQCQSITNNGFECW